MTRGRADDAPFSARDGAAVTGSAALWGGSFVLIAYGLDHLTPELVAWGRCVFGALALAAFPAARVAVPRAAWPPIFALAAIWMAIPFLLYSVAQQRVDSSVAGMVNGSVPLFTAVVAALWSRTLPSAMRVLGLAIGFLGVVLVSLPNLSGPGGDTVGVLLLLVAVALFGLAFNLTERVQAAYGTLPSILRTVFVAAVMLTIPAAASVPRAEFALGSVVAVAALGVFGTGIAFYLFTGLIDRVGSTRASVVTFVVPALSIVAGAVFRDEQVAPLAILGTAVIIIGAVIVSRSPGRRPPVAGAG